MGEAALKLKSMSVETYLERERVALVKHEYLHGQLFAMAGASERHNLIAGNVFSYLRAAALKQAYRVFMSDMKLRIADERFYYPDAMVTCDKDDNATHFKVAPCLLVEVLSSSTANTYRREKLFAYQMLASLQSYIIIDPETRYVEHYKRDAAGEWWYHEFKGQGELELNCPNIKLSLDNIYEAI